MDNKAHATDILQRLAIRYPEPEPALDWTDAWELLVATVLAAQCADVRVNQVTPGFFKRWPGIADLAGAEVEEIEEVVRSTGFFRNKAKNLKGAASLIMAEFGGEVPRTMAELIRLPGVARKTANIVLSNAFGVHEGIAVDTHVTRLAFRLGLTEHTDAVKIERDLMPLFERSQWGDINHFLVYFGREVCPARTPRCSACELADLCPKKGVDKHA
ncbi:MAG: endonuclease III, partial [Proteobacteria bacterium]|nr:endonuclease III [Pseudomonadota bacterium]